jgi:[ribosomal protein S18]-alanine N-acetyltransferase
MTEDDVSPVAAIEILSFPRRADPTDAGALPTPEARLREELLRPWSHAWVIRGEDSRPLSFLVAWLVADEVHVLNVAAHPAHRRRGMGSSLVAHVIVFASVNGARHILLEVRRSNEDGIRLYRAAGFFAARLRRRYYPDDEDAVEMQLVLDPTTGEVLPRADEVSLDA